MPVDTANDYLTLLDVAKMGGNDQIIALIEESLIIAPEVKAIKGTTIAGTTYKISRRINLPDSVGFRNANEGQIIGKSDYDQDLVECFIFGAEMEVDTAVAKAHPRGAAACLDTEAIGFMKAAVIRLGAQLYYGNNASDKGFKGLGARLPYSTDPFSTHMKAGGSGANSNLNSSIYFLQVVEDGAQFVYGQDGSMDMGEWVKQQVTRKLSDGVTLGKLTAWVNNFLSFVGFQVGHTKSIGRISNIDPYYKLHADIASYGINDDKVNEILSHFPIDRIPTHVFMNRSTRLQLQRSRSAEQTVTGINPTAPTPVDVGGIPIILTDSISTTEAVVA